MQTLFDIYNFFPCNSMSASSRQRILNVMGTFRPAFRSVAQSLTDIDLILVEEAFERLLLVNAEIFVVPSFLLLGFSDYNIV